MCVHRHTRSTHKNKLNKHRSPALWVHWGPPQRTPPLMTCGSVEVWFVMIRGWFLHIFRRTEAVAHLGSASDETVKSITQSAWQWRLKGAISVWFWPADRRWCTPSHFVVVHQLLWFLQEVDLLREKQISLCWIGQQLHYICLCCVNINDV